MDLSVKCHSKNEFTVPLDSSVSWKRKNREIIRICKRTLFLVYNGISWTQTEVLSHITKVILQMH